MSSNSSGTRSVTSGLTDVNPRAAADIADVNGQCRGVTKFFATIPTGERGDAPAQLVRLGLVCGRSGVVPRFETVFAVRLGVSVEYIQSYRGTPDTLDASLERIRATAQRLSAELDAIRFNVEHDPGPA